MTTAPKRTALIVEDDADDLLFLTNSLDDQFRLYISGSLASALETLSRLKPDVVLLDLKLPDSEFPETLACIHPVRGVAAIVIVSGNGDDEFMRRCLESGANGFLFKNRLAFIDVVGEIRKAIEHQAELLRQEQALALAAGVKKLEATWQASQSSPIPPG